PCSALRPPPLTATLFPYTTLFRSRHNLDDVPILNRVVATDDHLRTRVDGADEVVPQIRVHLKGYVRRGGTARDEERVREDVPALDRKSTRLNSSHVAISYAVFCLK